MSDKDLYVVIAEMLRKQDQQSEILELHTVELKRIAEILQSFIVITTGQFEQQQKFNERFLYTQDKMSLLLERVVDRMGKMEERFDGLEKRFDDFSIQSNTNFSLITDRLSGIESKLR